MKGNIKVALEIINVLALCVVAYKEIRVHQIDALKEILTSPVVGQPSDDTIQ